MLIKRLCKVCYDRNRYRSWDDHRRRDKKTGEMYVQKDRTWDERGIMFCVALMDGTWEQRRKAQIKVTGEPPQCCHYLAEQLMAASVADSSRTSDSPGNE